MENNDLADLINRAGFARLYDNKSSDPKNNAQLNLEGRNYFATDSTLRAFGSRINSAHPTASNLLFYVIESSYTNWEKTKRGFKFVVFDIFGEEVNRLSIAEAVSTSEKARKAMYSFLNNFDVAEYYAQKLESIARKADREAGEARAIAQQITESEAMA
jgi:hypothetical protein